MTKTAKGLALGAAVALASLALAPAAAAQPPTTTDKNKGGYEYRFHDDLMQGVTMGANAPRITVVKMGRRDRLIRPRLHFVPEMLKSVEKM